MLALCFLLALWGCSSSSEKEDVLRTVMLPDLAQLEDTVQQQLMQQHARLVATTRNQDPQTQAEAYGTFGRYLLAYGFYNAAESSLVNAQQLAPNDPQWPYYLGHRYRVDQQPAQAVPFYERARSLRPDDTPTLVRLGQVYIDLGQNNEAEQVLQQALERDSTVAFAHFLLGELAAERSAFESAAAHFRAVLRLQPQASVAEYPLGLAYRNLQDEARSQHHLGQRGFAQISFEDPLAQGLDRLKVNVSTFLYQGKSLLENGRVAEAVAAFEKAIAQDSQQAMAYQYLALTRAQLKDYQGAIDAARGALRLDSLNTGAHYTLSVALALEGQVQEAIDTFEALLRIDPRHGDAHLGLGELLRREQRCAAAVVHFERVLALAPNREAARFQSALCYTRLKRYADARAVLEAGHQANPQHLALMQALARVLAASPAESARDGQRALALARQLAAGSSTPEILETLAMAHAEVGDFAEALSWQEQALRLAQDQQKPDAYLAHLGDNLLRYQHNKPCRQPWPDMVYKQRINL